MIEAIKFALRYDPSPNTRVGAVLVDKNNKIKAFDVLGPAFIKYDSKIIKIHKYTEDNSNFAYELKDGLLYLDEITPEGKKRMKANDYMRGLQ